MTRILIIVVAFVVGGGALLGGACSPRAQDSGLRVYDLGTVCLYAEAQNWGGLWGVTKAELGMGPTVPCPDGRSATPR